MQWKCTRPVLRASAKPHEMRWKCSLAKPCTIRFMTSPG
jgi:hypothetical protein